MAADEDDPLAQALALMPELAEHLERAARLLPPWQRGTDGADEPLSDTHRALDIARRALTHVAELVEGMQRDYLPRAGLALGRGAERHELSILGTPSAEDVAAFIVELRRYDERVLASAELAGLLLGLALRWATAGFAPPLVLASIGEHVPQILALGRRIEGSDRSLAGSIADDGTDLR